MHDMRKIPILGDASTGWQVFVVYIRLILIKNINLCVQNYICDIKLVYFQAHWILQKPKVKCDPPLGLFYFHIWNTRAVFVLLIYLTYSTHDRRIYFFFWDLLLLFVLDRDYMRSPWIVCHNINKVNKTSLALFYFIVNIITFFTLMVFIIIIILDHSTHMSIK